MVNPPLASTAVGVVAPQRSGMASGVNTTFRQIGIATGIAAYGSIFASSLHSKLGQALAGCTRRLHQLLPTVVTAIQQGNAVQAIDAVPGPTRTAGRRHSLQLRRHARRAVGRQRCPSPCRAACALALIRTRDFVVTHQPEPERAAWVPSVPLAVRVASSRHRAAAGAEMSGEVRVVLSGSPRADGADRVTEYRTGKPGSAPPGRGRRHRVTA